jgi:hypothetical protein
MGKLTRIIGDIHGEWELYHQTATDAINFGGCERTIQVGDFGVGFAGPYWHDRADEFHWDGTHRFIRGNHDDPARCQKMTGWIKDGFIENDVMFVGGAWSIDHALRTEGVSWWADEELSMEELYRMIAIYEQVKPRVMITHDCPQEVSTQMFIQSGLALFKGNAKTIPTRTAMAFSTMLDIHQPEEWYFGHWHNTMQYKYGRTMFHCLGIHDYVDVEL